MGKYQKNIEAARRITVMQYLETYHPGELVRKTDREYCTRTHDSLIITPANGFFHWFSRNVGGNNAIDVDIHLKLVIDEWQFPKSK